MTHTEWRETLHWAKDRFWGTLDIPSGAAEAIYEHLQYFPKADICRAVQEHAFEHYGKRYPSEGLWKDVERRCRDARRVTPDSEVVNEHGHTEAVRGNIAKEMKRPREDSTYPDLSKLADAEAYKLFLVTNKYIPQGQGDDYPGHRYGDRSRLDPDGAGRMTTENRLTLITGFRFKKAEPEKRKAWLR